MEAFLKNCELGEWLDVFSKNLIEMDDLADLTEDEIKELLPPIGLRHRLKRAIKRKISEAQEETRVSNPKQRKRTTTCTEFHGETAESVPTTSNRGTNVIVERFSRNDAAKKERILNILKTDEALKSKLIEMIEEAAEKYTHWWSQINHQLIDFNEVKLNCPFCPTKLVPQFRKTSPFRWMVDNLKRHLSMAHPIPKNISGESNASEESSFDELNHVNSLHEIVMGDGEHATENVDSNGSGHNYSAPNATCEGSDDSTNRRGDNAVECDDECSGSRPDGSDENIAEHTTGHDALNGSGDKFSAPNVSERSDDSTNSATFECDEECSESRSDCFVSVSGEDEYDESEESYPPDLNERSIFLSSIKKKKGIPQKHSANTNQTFLHHKNILHPISEELPQIKVGNHLLMRNMRKMLTIRTSRNISRDLKIAEHDMNIKNPKAPMIIPIVVTINAAGLVPMAQMTPPLNDASNGSGDNTNRRPGDNTIECDNGCGGSRSDGSDDTAVECDANELAAEHTTDIASDGSGHNYSAPNATTEGSDDSTNRRGDNAVECDDQCSGSRPDGSDENIAEHTTGHDAVNGSGDKFSAPNVSERSDDSTNSATFECDEECSESRSDCFVSVSGEDEYDESEESYPLDLNERSIFLSSIKKKKGIPQKHSANTNQTFLHHKNILHPISEELPQIKVGNHLLMRNMRKMLTIRTSRNISRDLKIAEHDMNIKKTGRIAAIFREICEDIGDYKDKDGKHLLSVLSPPSKEECPEYYEIIETPIDLSTIKANVENCRYADPVSFDKDVLRLFNNVLHFYGSESIEGAAAKNLLKFYATKKENVHQRLLIIVSDSTMVKSFLPDEPKYRLVNVDSNENVVRCICGLFKDNVIMIQCIKCLMWQHTECVGADTKAEHYMCERCNLRTFEKEILMNEVSKEGFQYYLTLMRGDLQVRQTDTVYILRDIPIAPSPNSTSTSPTKKHTYKTIGRIDYKECDIFRVERLWKDNDGNRFVYGHQYFRPSETYHEPTRKFYPNEIVRVPLYEELSIDLVVGRCWVLDPKTFAKGRPVDCEESHVYICELRVDKRAYQFSKIAKQRYPTCTKPYAFRVFEEKLKISRNYSPHHVDQATVIKKNMEKTEKPFNLKLN